MHVKIEKILNAIDKALDEGAHPVAAFDADGTLWDTDVGESFFDFQIKNEVVPLPDDPWAFYREMKAKDARKAYLWLAQINKGKSLSEVHGWARAALKEGGGPPLFDGQIRIINHLLKQNVEVFIVTASIKWAVDPAAALFGLPDSNVLGVKTKVSDGIITDIQDGPITYLEGKAEALLEASGGRAPVFCSGNSPGDLALLESATHVRFVNSATRENNPIHQTEMKLIEIAKERGWFFHRH